MALVIWLHCVKHLQNKPQGLSTQAPSHHSCLNLKGCASHKADLLAKELMENVPVKLSSQANMATSFL